MPRDIIASQLKDKVKRREGKERFLHFPFNGRVAFCICGCCNLCGCLHPCGKMTFVESQRRKNWTRVSLRAFTRVALKSFEVAHLSKESRIVCKNQ